MPREREMMLLFYRSEGRKKGMNAGGSIDLGWAVEGVPFCQLLVFFRRRKQNHELR